jgi:antitoxin (DNA-binding transcriptional repressor) of toxin-antitoxin stability system
MKVATVADARSHLSALIDDVGAGEEVVITRRGKPVARLVREPSAPSPSDWQEACAWVASARAAFDGTVAELRELDLL